MAEVDAGGDAAVHAAQRQHLVQRAQLPYLAHGLRESEEGPGLGGAMLAAVACGEYASVEEAAGKIVKVIDTVEPDPVLAAKYEERYQQFKQIYPACKPLFDIIA